MTIGVITTSYPRFTGDPAGNFVGAHVDALRALGHDVDVIAAGDGPGRIASSLFYRGGAPDLLEHSPRTVLAAACFIARLAVAVSQRRWELIVAHWLAPSAIAALPSRAPLLAIAHGGDIHTLRRTHLLAPLLYALRARGARLAFVSADLLAIARAAAPPLASWLDRSAIVQPMGVDLARFRALPHAKTRPPTILVAARLVPIKGVDVALAAFAHVRGAGTLVIAGDGPDRAALQASAPERVRFVGEVDAAARDRLLGAADVVVVPSRVLANGRTEGMPMIAVEALAAGVPVVASAVGGLRELAPHVLLVPPDDPHALAAAIDHAIASPPPRPSLTSFDWQAVAVRLLRHGCA